MSLSPDRHYFLSALPHQPANHQFPTHISTSEGYGIRLVPMKFEYFVHII